VFAFRISPYLYGALIVAAGLLTKLSLAARRFSRPLLFVGLTHLAARFLVGILKPPFSRIRPFEALTAHGWHDQWFAPIGNSFPSGHAVHFWSLFFPLAVLFPQYRLAMFVLPVLVSIARVAVNDHYLGDVLTSCAVAALSLYGSAPSSSSGAQPVNHRDDHSVVFIASSLHIPPPPATIGTPAA
jgi:membrane-associated phospholipid phosphatase